MKTIKLTQGKFALVDDADYEAVNAHKWCAHRHKHLFHVVRNVRTPSGSRSRQATQYLHTFLLPDAGRIDHRDGNGLNNQRANLRPATHKQNMQGFRRKRADMSSRFRGVSWHILNLKWIARIRVDGKLKHLGYFTFEVDAALAYNEAANKYFGEFAQLNKF